VRERTSNLEKTEREREGVKKEGERERKKRERGRWTVRKTANRYHQKRRK